jgi:hypothetical protein
MVVPMIRLPDPLQLMRPTLREEIGRYIEAVLGLARRSLKCSIELNFSAADNLRSTITESSGGFVITIPERLIACVCLQLRLLSVPKKQEGIRYFLPQHDSEDSKKQKMSDPDKYVKSRNVPLHPKYAAMVGVLGDPEAIQELRWWKNTYLLAPAKEPDEFRYGARYALLFCLLHEIGHAVGNHFDIRTTFALRGYSDFVNATELDAAFEIDADTFAFDTLFYLAMFIAKYNSKTHMENCDRLSIEIYRILFGVHTALSIFDVHRWVPEDYEGLTYFHPSERIAFNVWLNNQWFADFGGSTYHLFARFSWWVDETPVRSELFPIEQPARRGDFIEFARLTLEEWNGRADDFLYDTHLQHHLPLRPLPFAFSRFSDFGSESAQMLDLLRQLNPELSRANIFSGQYEDLIFFLKEIGYPIF